MKTTRPNTPAQLAAGRKGTRACPWNRAPSCQTVQARKKWDPKGKGPACKSS